MEDGEWTDRIQSFNTTLRRDVKGGCGAKIPKDLSKDMTKTNTISKDPSKDTERTEPKIGIWKPPGRESRVGTEKTKQTGIWCRPDARPTNRQTETQTDRQTDRQANKQIVHVSPIQLHSRVKGERTTPLPWGYKRGYGKTNVRQDKNSDKHSDNDKTTTKTFGKAKWKQGMHYVKAGRKDATDRRKKKKKTMK
jgi:hypothetical protein